MERVVYVKRVCKILMFFSMILLCATVITDARVMETIATVGGGFLKSIKLLATVGGGFLDKVVYVIPYL